MKAERMKVRDNYREFVRQKTIGTDLDIEHYLMFCEQAEIMDMKKSDYLRSIVIPAIEAKQDDMIETMRQKWSTK